MYIGRDDVLRLVRPGLSHVLRRVERPADRDLDLPAILQRQAASTIKAAIRESSYIRAFLNHASHLF